LHFSIAHTDCKDSLLSPCKDSDNLTSTLLGHILDEEKPDLVVFTGDQLNGQGTTWDTKSVFAKFAVAVTERQIPWTAVFGNHDDEDGALKVEQMKLLQALPYSLVERGPKDVHGVGNYVLKVKSADPLSKLCDLARKDRMADKLLNRSKTHLLTLYFLDSGSYSKGYFDWLGWFRPTEYDYLHQVN
jgi:DNA repair exonuclease SbcCD nuclease subunit